MNVSHLRQSLASGQSEKALQQLVEQVGNSNPAWRRAALLLRASWVANEQQADKNLISYEEAQRMRNRIVDGALKLVDDIESGAGSPQALLEGLQDEFLNHETALLMDQDNDQTNLSGASIEVDDGGSVIIGEGNTVNKKVFNALGKRQFFGIFIVLIILLGGGYFGIRLLAQKQDTTYASLSDIKKELLLQADLNSGLRARLETNRAEIEGWIEKGMNALKQEDYSVAAQYLEKVASEAPLAKVHQNLAYAYEQMGDLEASRKNIEAAKAIDPTLNIAKSYESLKGRRINLLNAENGGKMLVASTSDMSRLVDASESTFTVTSNSFAVFGFLEKRKATFNQLKYLIPESSDLNFLEFDLFYGNDSMEDNFVPIGSFKVKNVFFTESPFQEINFPAVTARYFKIVLKGAGYGSYAYEMQLMGTLEK